ncbi:P-loop containing nucleoside triphosphate hydrolase protein [Gloeophyllum trabeum ATCC 11539]|uniref:p-loop containing nucleoside triphosphate hydrolase protein n=1 Tax=Gloeophyllum trabeum (strain ATCC 11539 / FP-39264 / Madison 617) TaxID=670483 RepID=S7S435_GLOTA|nr:P-loop containing nucleoside triphosphate hydrolase protein [Gloeophyllum trabeum ATCC 11539]EPQ60619.1 P-loop containing nucleoside triphosphate hydrolase protein [Gloeophyllum trabeum ATCC 11539]
MPICFDRQRTLAILRLLRTRRNCGTRASESNVLLRPYQEACLDACMHALHSGLSRVGVSLPTGSGKTTVFVSLLSRIPVPVSSPEATRSLVIVNGRELAYQAAEQARKLRPDWEVDIEQGQKHRASGRADVTVATYQTLLRGDRLGKFDPARLKAIVVDEAHHAASPSYRNILSHFAPAIKSPDGVIKSQVHPHTIPIIGFSATFSRHDGLALGSVFERIVYHRSFLEMMKEQWLCNVRFTSVHANMNLNNVSISSRSGDFVTRSLAQVINTDTVNKLVVQSWLDRASTRKSTLVFCVNLAHVAHLTKTFREAGVDARYLYAGTPVAERTKLITEFREGTFPVLVNCGILTEGADIPNIDCVVLARPTRSRNLFAQMIGRGMRLSPGTGKEDCLIIDFVDSRNRVAGIVCVPTLFGLDPSEVIDGETVDSLQERAAPTADGTQGLKADSPDDIPDPTSVTYIDYEDPFELADQASGAPHIAALSPLSWVGCGDDIYVLECLGRGQIRLEKVKGAEGEEEYWKAHYNSILLDRQTAASMRLPPYARSREILKAHTLEEAVRGCDTYAQKKVLRGPQAVGLLRSAAWRRHPATDTQKEFIRKRWGSRKITSLQDFGDGSKVEEYDQRIAKLTKGEAANIITRLKHGAQVR